MKFRRRLFPRYLQIILICSILFPIWIVFVLEFYHEVKVELNGIESIKTDVNKPYIDEGFILYDNNKIVDNKKITYIKSSNVDVTKLGEYTYQYEVKYNGKKYYLKRTVKVVDEDNPIIDINTNEVKLDYCTNKPTNKLKYTIIDNYDGDITDKATTRIDNDKYIIEAIDSSNNKTDVELDISYSNKPKSSLKLNGSSTINVKLNGTYKEAGAKYIDGCNVARNADIKIEGSVDTSNVGIYTIKYSYKNLSVTRKVNVYEPTMEQPSNGKKIIYLTFDDGPSKYTRQLLDILDKYNVKATFFVVGRNTSIIKEEYERGHTIGVHSLTHEWSIYKSLDAYLDDFNKMNAIIEKQTGSKSMIFRFPGGSSNSVSKRYATGIVKKIADYMTNAGYVYFDWNVSAGDASSNTGEQVYKSVVNGVKNCTKCVILMHDSKQKTVNQVENIIKTFIDRGYEFRTLDTNGPIVHHHIKN